MAACSCADDEYDEYEEEPAPAPVVPSTPAPSRNAGRLALLSPRGRGTVGRKPAPVGTVQEPGTFLPRKSILAIWFLEIVQSGSLGLNVIYASQTCRYLNLRKLNSLSLLLKTFASKTHVFPVTASPSFVSMVSEDTRSKRLIKQWK